jgi:hypothetical protein
VVAQSGHIENLVKGRHAMKRPEEWFWLELSVVMLGAFLSLAVPSPVRAAPKVEVTNTPLPVTEVDNAAQNRFQAEAKITTAGNGTITIGSFTHPPKILVIEFVSGTCTTNSVTKIAQLGFQTVAAGVSATHGFVPILLFSDGSTNHYAISQQTRIYADPNATIPVTRTVLTSLPEVINCSIAISGYLSP